MLAEQPGDHRFEHSSGDRYLGRRACGLQRHHKVGHCQQGGLAKVPSRGKRMSSVRPTGRTPLPLRHGSPAAGPRFSSRICGLAALVLAHPGRSSSVRSSNITTGFSTILRRTEWRTDSASASKPPYQVGGIVDLPSGHGQQASDQVPLHPEQRLLGGVVGEIVTEPASSVSAPRSSAGGGHAPTSGARAGCRRPLRCRLRPRLGDVRNRPPRGAPGMRVVRRRADQGEVGVVPGRERGLARLMIGRPVRSPSPDL